MKEVLSSTSSSSALSALVKRNRAAGRLGTEPLPRAGQKKVQQSGMWLPADELAWAKEEAQLEGRTASNFMRMLFLKGRQAYEAQKSASVTTAGF